MIEFGEREPADSFRIIAMLYSQAVTVDERIHTAAVDIHACAGPLPSLKRPVR